MTILILTSSYPSDPSDATGTAGLFVRDFARELVENGHSVICMPVARKVSYHADPGITIEPIPWTGGDQELASLSLGRPSNWLVVARFFLAGIGRVRKVAAAGRPDRILCMWAVPAGVFGWRVWKTSGIPYDIWALGSDIWRVRSLPFGTFLLRRIMKHARRLFADGRRLSADVSRISGSACSFLPSARRLPEPDPVLPPLEPVSRRHFLFVGRYHRNKGPDILVEAAAKLSPAVKEKIKLHMFGVGILKNELLSLVRRHSLQECVVVHDAIDAREFSNYLSLVRFLIIPSRIESIPIVLSDAAQRGVPVIASDTGDLGTIVKEYDAGIVVPSSDADALARGIEEALSADVSRYRAGSLRLAARFDIGSICREWLSA